jgi:hypothetical protein
MRLSGSEPAIASMLWFGSYANFVLYTKAAPKTKANAEFQRGHLIQ